jgi:SAM-dependent methyltransferase
MSRELKIKNILSVIVGGGKWIESLLTRLLKHHYKFKTKREWEYVTIDKMPHFTNHRVTYFNFAYGDNPVTAMGMARAFFTAELVNSNDTVLDIGCGDGFITNRFIANRCKKVDGIDIEPTAIKFANEYNKQENITYYLMDAVEIPFPGKQYDIIVWDGAIGHFDARASNKMMEKIVASLSPEGVFVGSESLGKKEGHDHLQFFESLPAFADLFKKYFKYVRLKEIEYPINVSGFIRQEAYWRCSNSQQRLAEKEWISF